MGLVVVCAFISIFHIERDGATKKRGGAVRDRTRFYDKNGKKAENKMEVRFSDANFETEWAFAVIVALLSFHQ